MRPIDADSIPYMMLYKENRMKGTGEEAQGAWKSDIDKMPTIDAVPVVRCKYCKHSREDDVFGTRWCQKPGSIKVVKDEFFCAYGERKEDA